MIALLIISLILLTIFVSIYLLSNKYTSKKEKQLKLAKETKVMSSSRDKQEWAMKMAEIRKQKKIQREKELDEWKIKQDELLKKECEKFIQLEKAFNEIGASIVFEEEVYNENIYAVYTSENINVEKLFELYLQSFHIKNHSISKLYIIDNEGNGLLKLDFYEEIWCISFLQEEKENKIFSKKNIYKQVQNFLLCYLENRKIKRIEELWDNIIVNGVAESEKLLLEGQDIVERVTSALKSSNYGSVFNQSLECMFENGMLVIDYELPDISKYPAIKEYKHVLSTNEINIKKQSESYISKGYEKALYAITLRTIYETFCVDKDSEIKIVTFNGFISSINPSTGLMERKCILSIQVAKERFTQINIVNVDPKSCFKSLKGVSAAKLITLSPINPILSFNKNDKRFIAERQVNTDQGTNLAAMHWEDFEQLVRELFELEFAQNGSEVKVTQASRDGGVDAIIFDPDPLRGGKIVIQAKRYTNTVGVSAVRDLYGTVINEGANTGILITTSDYGHDSYEFAKDKPLKLLNGGHLLALLLKNGRNAYINIEEAKKLNQTETEN
ncbi:MAG: restriction endonuclease [Paludibacteraceae bacterium]|nr:restriction endonuclease [Paludibacteraceae bacterium]